MKARYVDEARLDLLGAVAHYESVRIGLGLDFASEAERRVEQIEKYPLASTILEGDVRVLMMRRFPYGLIYRIVSDEAIILAVIHLHREPGTWKSRLRE